MRRLRRSVAARSDTTTPSPRAAAKTWPAVLRHAGDAMGVPSARLCRLKRGWNARSRLDAQAGRHGRRPGLQHAEMLHAAALQRLVEAAARAQLRRDPERLRHLGHHALAVGRLAQHELDELAARREQRQPVAVRGRRDPAGIARQVGVDGSAACPDRPGSILTSRCFQASEKTRPRASTARPAGQARPSGKLRGSLPLSRSMRQMLPEALRSQEVALPVRGAVGRRAVGDEELAARHRHRGDAARRPARRDSCGRRSGRRRRRSRRWRARPRRPSSPTAAQAGDFAPWSLDARLPARPSRRAHRQPLPADATS